jgi:hypothetical protein
MSVMKRKFLFLVSAGAVAMLCQPAFAMTSAMVTSCPAGMDQKVETLSGMFKIHVICDHVMFEIPAAMLNRDMLVNTEFAALSTGSDFVAPGSSSAGCAAATSFILKTCATRCGRRT